ncbi:MAG: zinc ribbon domain-containing protein [Gemmatimonadales bacterium]|nr:zinc ribbon domain-containing protein [Gemmatimonadales bacterium]
MPTYAYHCASCGHGFERFEKMSADPKPPSPECRRLTQRLISGGVGLVVKGSAGAPVAGPSGCCGGACSCH